MIWRFSKKMSENSILGGVFCRHCGTIGRGSALLKQANAMNRHECFGLVKTPQKPPNDRVWPPQKSLEIFHVERLCHCLIQSYHNSCLSSASPAIWINMAKRTSHSKFWGERISIIATLVVEHPKKKITIWSLNWTFLCVVWCRSLLPKNYHEQQPTTIQLCHQTRETF